MEEHMKAKQDEALERILRAIGNPPEEVYAPSDDSFLMVDAISGIRFAGKTVLDLGTGSGILGFYCALQGGVVTVADIDESALQHARKSAASLCISLTTIRSDLFSEISDAFDFVLFNPPYLPSLTIKDRTVDGGRMGRDLMERFLKALSGHLKKGGLAFLLVSAVNNVPALIQEHSELEFSTVAKRSLFFEELQVLRVRLLESLARQ